MVKKTKTQLQQRQAFTAQGGSAANQKAPLPPERPTQPAASICRLGRPRVDPQLPEGPQKPFSASLSDSTDRGGAQVGGNAPEANYDVILCHRADEARVMSCFILDQLSHPAFWDAERGCPVPIWTYRTAEQRESQLKRIRHDAGLRPLEIEHVS